MDQKVTVKWDWQIIVIWEKGKTEILTFDDKVKGCQAHVISIFHVSEVQTGNKAQKQLSFGWNEAWLSIPLCQERASALQSLTSVCHNKQREAMTHPSSLPL